MDLGSTSLNVAKTPLTYRTTRYIHWEYRLEPTRKRLDLIFRGYERLATQVSINNHIIKGLQQTIQIEKSKRKKGKRLNLVREEDSRPQFFTPARVKAALEYQAEKEDQEEAEKQVRIENKARKALEKEEKEARKKLALEERLRKRAGAQSEKFQKAIERIEKAAERKAQLEEKRALLLATKAIKKASIASNKAREAQKGKRKLVESNNLVESAPVAKRVAATNSRGRPVITLARYIQLV